MKYKKISLFKLLTIFLLFSSFHLSLISFEKLNTYFNENQHQYLSALKNVSQNTAISNDWLKDFVYHNHSIPSTILQKISNNPSLFTTLREEMRKEISQWFFDLKEKILASSNILNNIQAFHTISQQFDIIESTFGLPSAGYHRYFSQNMFKYPEWFIAQEAFKKLKAFNEPLCNELVDTLESIGVRQRELKTPVELLNQQTIIPLIQSLNIRSKNDITAEHLKKIHAHLLNYLPYASPGEYRTEPCTILSYSVIFPEARTVPDHMEKLITWLHNEPETDIISLAVNAHLKFMAIHPFIDGNKRVALLLLNLILITYDYEPFIIAGSHPGYNQYAQALKESLEHNNPKALQEIIIESVGAAELDAKIDYSKAPAIGLIGGSFDPLHIGHDEVVQQALATKTIDYVIINTNSSNSKKVDIVPLPLRRHMAHLIYGPEQAVIASLWPGSKTIAYLKAKNPSITIVGLIGEDTIAINNSPSNKSLIDKWLIDKRGKSAHEILNSLAHSEETFTIAGKPARFLETTKIISSTHVKKLFKENNEAQAFELLHPRLVKYLQTNTLYRS